MRISEIIVDALNRTPLFEMAFARRDARDKVSDLALNVAMHLTRVLAFEHQARNHWKSEINAWLGKIFWIKIKPKGTRFRGDEYYTLLFQEPFGDTVDSVTEEIERESDMTRSALSPQQVYELCEKILHRISQDIANNKLGSISQYLTEFGID